MPSFSSSAAGLAMIKQLEGLQLTAYRDQTGRWTIGYGHTGADVHAGLTITPAQAEELLDRDLAAAVAGVNRAVTSAINQSQFDALVDFAFNLGCGSLLSSTLLRLVNAGDFTAAAQQFLLWDHAAGAVVPGLLERRRAELELFES